MHTYLWGRQTRGQGVIATDYRQVALPDQRETNADDVDASEETLVDSTADDSSARYK